MDQPSLVKLHKPKQDTTWDRFRPKSTQHAPGHTVAHATITPGGSEC